MLDLMLDIETLGTSPDTVILSLGVVKFNPFTEEIGDGIYIKPDVDHQLTLGRAVDPQTVEWWGQQDPAVREETFSDDNRISLEEFTTSLNKFVAHAPRIWAQGPCFDIVILENLYRQLGMPAPWPFYVIRDCRTLLKALGDTRTTDSSVMHNALADCINQAQAVQRAIAKYKLVEL